MSKKLIAVASATALALAAIAGPALASAPANGTFRVDISGNIAGTGANATTAALTVSVPTSDIVRTNRAAINFKVYTTTETGTITASSTGGVKLLSTTQAATAKSTSGAQSLTVTAAGYVGDVYAFTTSTSAGTVTITNGGNTVTYFVAGVSEKGYKIAVSGSGSASVGVEYEVTVKVTDMFGNPVSGLETDLTFTGFGAFASTPSVETAVEETAVDGTYTAGLAVADTGAGLLTATLAGSAADAAVAAFGKRVLTGTLSVNSSDPAVAIANLQKQVVALQEIVDRKVSKKRYNTLARKWNKAFPTQKVALKK
jgi:hypothetical protein